MVGPQEADMDMELAAAIDEGKGGAILPSLVGCLSANHDNSAWTYDVLLFSQPDAWWPATSSAQRLAGRSARTEGRCQIK
jgi:hypothetical protein